LNNRVQLNKSVLFRKTVVINVELN
jgi:hypothetical protein